MMLVLLLALVLPLQSFAAAWSCSAHDMGGATLAHHHCANDSGNPQSSGELRHHCGTCCAVAIALMPLRWTAPRSASPEASLAPHRSAPKVVLDRLDRPPRPV
jgi:hypothetical protein